MNDVISTELLLEATTQAGLRDRVAARRIVDATLAVLSRALTRDERDVFARVLSPALREPCAVDGAVEALAADEVYRRIARRARVRAGLAREQAQVIIETIGRHASYEAVRKLSRAWPSEIAALLDERTLGEPPPYVETLPVAQHHSVVREANPHGDRKLSSGRPVFRPSDSASGTR